VCFFKFEILKFGESPFGISLDAVLKARGSPVKPIEFSIGAGELKALGFSFDG